MNIAYVVLEIIEDDIGMRTIYRMDPPYLDYEYICISAILPKPELGIMKSETYIFTCNKEGYIINWKQLAGSIQGVYDISLVLKNIGYKEVNNYANPTEDCDLDYDPDNLAFRIEIE